MSKTKTLFKVPVGDWSKDGHNQSEDYYILANYSAQEMRQAYKDTCKKIGLQMNHSTNYTELEEANSYNTWRMLLCDYEESSITEEACEILIEHGFDFERVDGERDENGKMVAQETYFDSDGVFDLFMWFIAYSMPTDFEFEDYIKDEPESIIGYWNSGLNHQIGYGVFY